MQHTTAREALNLYTYIVNASDDFMNIIDSNYCYVAVSDPLCQAFQCSRESLIGKSVGDIWGHELFDNGIRSRLDQCLAGKPVEHEFEFCFPDTGLRWYSSRFIPYRDLQGCVTHAVVISHDITNRVNSRQALKMSKDRLEFLLHSAPVIIYSREAEQPWSLNFVSQNIRQQFGYDENSLLGKVNTWEKHLHPDDCALLTDALHTLYEQGQNKLEYRLQDDRGVWHWLCDEMVLIKDAQGKPSEIVGYWVDISERIEAEQERKKLQAQIEHNQRLESLGVMASGIAHDFNNILAAIMGNASMATMDLRNNPESAEKYIERVMLSSEKAAELCKQMLAYAGKGSFDIRPINLTNMVYETHRLLEVSIPKNVSLKLDLDKNLPSVDADISQMQQIVMNLVINGSDAIAESQGTIRIQTGVMQVDREYLSSTYLDDNLPEGRYIYLDVADSGCGMNKQTLTSIFEPFFTTKPTGRGLGMSAVLGIIRSHRGAIKVESKVGVGTTFRIVLPLNMDAHTDQTDEGMGNKEKPLALGTVLLVDDDPDVLYAESQTLENMGFQVLTAVDGKDAIEVYRQHGKKIAVVLLDISMPNMGGKACLAELKRINHQVKVIFSSCYNEADAAECASGLSGFIQKPYRIEALKNLLEKVISTDTHDSK
ncbi:PAS domain S-box protein [Mariprofundus sp. EBB-1]|uniref:hybrid sensor histidine kinase/response regulator n=1 Tax=Mariprofundus sp. EBB-1 TaxID=2650971 RepID=UPI000EF1DACF|nr:PAS domain-containing protein [Mariprofundus sp. EBB-1]RLL54760.1 PAS domain S-box protein [Mariprofundus sp. EBB-1]